MRIGWIANEKTHLSQLALDYIEKLKDVIRGYGFDVD